MKRRSFLTMLGIAPVAAAVPAVAAKETAPFEPTTTAARITTNSLNKDHPNSYIEWVRDGSVRIVSEGVVLIRSVPRGN